MPTRPFCLLPQGFPADALGPACCRTGTHTHLSLAELREMRDLGLVEVNPDGSIAWLQSPDRDRRIRGAVRLARKLTMRGLSCRVGPELAQAVYRRAEWAQLMLTEIRRRAGISSRDMLEFGSGFGSNLGPLSPKQGPKP